jgi:hypothetical protein
MRIARSRRGCPCYVLFLFAFGTWLATGSPANAARTTEMYRMQPRPHRASEGVTDEQIRGAIVKAAERAGWRPYVRGARIVEVYISVRGGKHTATVEVEFDEQNYVVRYVTSYNLGHNDHYCGPPKRVSVAGPRRRRREKVCDGEIIHPHYNDWVRGLEDGILRSIVLLREGEPVRPISTPKKPAPSPAPLFVADELKKLKVLRDEGVLTEEEFDVQKRRLLGIEATVSESE